MSSITCTQTKNVHLLSTASKKIIKYQSIAPAMCPTSNIGGHHNDNDENKSRKYSQRISSYNSDPTQSVLRRNARERNRVKQVNNSFARLRQHIPQTIIADLTKSGGRGPHKKISKVDTLRIAVEYIRRLQNLLDDLNGNGNGSYTNFVNTTKNSRNILKTLTSCKSTSNIRQHFSSQITNISAVNSENKISAPANITIRTETENVAELNINRNTILLSSAVSLNSFSPQHKNTTQMDIDCKSPASTFNSNLSGDSSIYDHNSQTLQKQPIMPDQNSLIVEHLQLKFEPYENFHLHEDNCTPDDEEILDYISLWQDQ